MVWSAASLLLQSACSLDLFRDIRICDTGSAESAERVHGVKRFWQDSAIDKSTSSISVDTQGRLGIFTAGLHSRALAGFGAGAKETPELK
jgi:hypothetical protein